MLSGGGKRRENMENAIKRISQVGLVVRNREEAMAGFEKYLGIPQDAWDVNDAENIPGLEINGKPGTLNIHIAIVTFDNKFEIELIQPIGEGPFMDYLNEHGPGVHHFAMVMPDKNARIHELVKEFEDDGMHRWIHARMADIPDGIDFMYIDAREKMGAMIEMYNEPRD